MENKKQFVLDANAVKIKEILDKDFLSIEIYAIAEGENRNRSSFTLEAMQDAIPTFFNKFILGYFNVDDKKNGTGEFEEHNSDIMYDPELEEFYWSYTAPNAEKALGMIRESDSVEIVNYNGKNWIKTTAVLLTKYNREAVKHLLKAKKRKISVEISVLESHIEDNIEVIDKFVLDGITILGNMKNSNIPVEEGIEGASLSVLDFLTTNIFSKQRAALSFAYKKLEGKDEIDKLEENIDPDPVKTEEELTEDGIEGLEEGLTILEEDHDADIEITTEAMEQPEEIEDPKPVGENEQEEEITMEKEEMNIIAEEEREVMSTEVTVTEEETPVVAEENPAIEEPEAEAQVGEIPEIPAEENFEQDNQLALPEEEINDNKNFEGEGTKVELTYLQKRELLENALAKLFEEEESYAWVCDFTDDYVIYEKNCQETFKASYTIDEDGVVTIDIENQVIVVRAWEEVPAEKKVVVEEEEYTIDGLLEIYNGLAEKYNTVTAELEELKKANFEREIEEMVKEAYSIIDAEDEIDEEKEEIKNCVDAKCHAAEFANVEEMKEFVETELAKAVYKRVKNNKEVEAKKDFSAPIDQPTVVEEVEDSLTAMKKAAKKAKNN